MPESSELTECWALLCVKIEGIFLYKAKWQLFVNMIVMMWWEPLLLYLLHSGQAATFKLINGTPSSDIKSYTLSQVKFVSPRDTLKYYQLFKDSLQCIY